MGKWIKVAAPRLGYQSALKILETFVQLDTLIQWTEYLSQDVQDHFVFARSNGKIAIRGGVMRLDGVSYLNQFDGRR